MKKIGIIGNIGSGKSYLSELLKERGNIVVDLDSVAKSFYHLENVKLEMKEIFGDDIYIYGELANKKLAEIIFNDNSKREQVEKLLKPYILQDLYDEFYYQEYHNKQDVIYVESATMMKTGLYKDFDKILIVIADYDLRKQHVIENRGISEEDFKKRNDSQIQYDETLYTLSEDGIDFSVIKNDFINSIKNNIKWL